MGALGLHGSSSRCEPSLGGDARTDLRVRPPIRRRRHARTPVDRPARCSPRARLCCSTRASQLDESVQLPRDSDANQHVHPPRLAQGRWSGTTPGPVPLTCTARPAVRSAKNARLACGRKSTAAEPANPHPTSPLPPQPPNPTPFSPTCPRSTSVRPHAPLACASARLFSAPNRARPAAGWRGEMESGAGGAGFEMRRRGEDELAARLALDLCLAGSAGQAGGSRGSPPSLASVCWRCLARRSRLGWLDRSSSFCVRLADLLAPPPSLVSSLRFHRTSPRPLTKSRQPLVEHHHRHPLAGASTFPRPDSSASASREHDTDIIAPSFGSLARSAASLARKTPRLSPTSARSPTFVASRSLPLGAAVACPAASLPSLASRARRPPSPTALAPPRPAS